MLLLLISPQTYSRTRPRVRTRIITRTYAHNNAHVRALIIRTRTIYVKSSLCSAILVILSHRKYKIVKYEKKFCHVKNLLYFCTRFRPESGGSCERAGAVKILQKKQILKISHLQTLLKNRKQIFVQVE